MALRGPLLARVTDNPAVVPGGALPGEAVAEFCQRLRHGPFGITKNFPNGWWYRSSK